MSYKVKKSNKPDYQFMVIKELDNVYRVVAYVPSYHTDGGKEIAEKIAELFNKSDVNINTFYG